MDNWRHVDPNLERAAGQQPHAMEARVHTHLSHKLSLVVYEVDVAIRRQEHLQRCIGRAVRPAVSGTESCA